MMMHSLLRYFQNVTNILRLHMFRLSNGLALCVIAYSLAIYSLQTLDYDYVEITTPQASLFILLACSLRI